MPTNRKADQRKEASQTTKTQISRNARAAKGAKADASGRL
jgi:hypothetical protein